MKKFKVTKEHLLCDYCRWNEPNEVIQFLQTERDIDLTDDNGIYFRLAVKYKSPKMLNALIEYFEQTKLQGDINSMEYKTALYTLKQMLQQAVDMWESSPEIQEILNKYIPEDDSDDETKFTESEHSSGDDHQLDDSEKTYDLDSTQVYNNIRQQSKEILDLLEQTKNNPHLKELRIGEITLPEDLSDTQKVYKNLKNFLHTLHNVEMTLEEFMEAQDKTNSTDITLVMLNDLTEKCQTDLISFLKNIETQSPHLLDCKSDESNSDKVLLIGDIDLGSQENHLKET